MGEAVSQKWIPCPKALFKQPDISISAEDRNRHPARRSPFALTRHGPPAGGPGKKKIKWLWVKTNGAILG